MGAQGSVTRLIIDLRSDEPRVREVAARLVWGRYFRGLLLLARNHLSARIHSREDEEDVLQSMYKSFCIRQRRGDFDLASRNAYCEGGSPPAAEGGVRRTAPSAKDRPGGQTGWSSNSAQAGYAPGPRDRFNSASSSRIRASAWARARASASARFAAARARRWAVRACWFAARARASAAARACITAV